MITAALQQGVHVEGLRPRSVELRAARSLQGATGLTSAPGQTPSPDTVLEVGCGGDYNSEIIAHSFPQVPYTGLDLSAAMIDVARKHYPTREFEVCSAYSLPRADRRVNIVLDGVALLHMTGWRKVLPEHARVARSQVIFQGLTLSATEETLEFAKYAHGRPTIECVFNSSQLLEVCCRRSLKSRPVSLFEK